MKINFLFDNDCILLILIILMKKHVRSNSDTDYFFGIKNQVQLKEKSEILKETEHGSKTKLNMISKQRSLEKLASPNPSPRKFLNSPNSYSITRKNAISNLKSFLKFIVFSKKYERLNYIYPFIKSVNRIKLSN